MDVSSSVNVVAMITTNAFVRRFSFSCKKHVIQVGPAKLKLVLIVLVMGRSGYPNSIRI